VVSGRYLEKGTTVSLEIRIGRPAPASLIVIQHLPQGTEIVSADPPCRKYNAARGEARWLLRKPAPGTLTIHLTLAQPAAAVSAELRCMDPATGRLVTTEVR
jgi:hypothetical protein